MNTSKTLSFIQQMQAQLTEYQLDKIKKRDELPRNRELTIKENKAKEALIKLQEIQNSKLNIEDGDQIGGWSNSKPTIQLDNINPKDRQKYTILPSFQQLKRQNTKSVNSRTIGVYSINNWDYQHETNRTIPQLKFLLERLNSPVKNKQQDKKSKFMNCRSDSREKLKVQFKNKNVKTKQDEKQQIKREQFKANDDFRNFQEIKPHRRESLKTRVENRIFSSKQDRHSNYTRKNEFQNVKPHYAAHNFINSKVNYEYEKIKRKNPSAYQIDLAHQKEILNQLIRGSNKDAFGYHSTKPSTARRKYSEKFTLTNLLQ